MQVVKTYNSNAAIVIPGNVKSLMVRTSQLNQFQTGAVTRFASMSVGYGSPLLIDTTGKAWGTGGNSSAQLGIGTLVGVSSFTQVLGAMNFKQIVSQGNSYGLTTSGTLVSWGLNTNGQLGLGDVINRSSPVAVLGSLSFASIACGAATGGPFYGITTSGKVFAMGRNLNGQLGDGTLVDKSSPVAVLGNLTIRQIIVSTSTQALFMDTAGGLWGTGANTGGELGVGDVVQRSSPVAVLGNRVWWMMSPTNGGTNIGLTNPVFEKNVQVGPAYGFGFNTNGQLGTGDVLSRSSPVAVLGGLNFKFVIQGGGSSYGITADGTAYAWGQNLNGQLGVGDVVPRSSPVAVLGGLKWKYFIADNSGGNTTVGITVDGLVYGMGQNASGQIGDGTTVAKSSPVAAIGGKVFQEIWGGINIFGFSTEGQVYSWGGNTVGQLGVGDITNRSSPVALSGGLFSMDWLPVTNEIVVPVIPGQTYQLKMGQQAVFFGTSQVAKGPVDYVQVIYENQ